MQRTRGKQRVLPGLLAAAAVVSLALAPAAVAAPNGNGTSSTKCSAGDLKKETTEVKINGVVVSSTTKTFVCNKKGQWRQVKEIVAGTGTFATAGTDVAGANAKPNGNGGTATCSDGGKLGEVRTFTREVWLNGKLIKKEKIKAKCGADGKWRPMLMPSEVDEQPQVATQGSRS
jgi:hypothetical protein